MKDYAIISSFFNALASLVCFIYLMIENKKNKVYANIIYSLSAISFFWWSFSYFLWQLSNNADSALFWCRMLMAGAIFIPITLFHFTVIFLDLEKQEKKIVIVGYVLTLFFLISDFTPFFVNRVESNAYFQFWPMPGFLFHPFLAMFFSLITYSYFLASKVYSKQSVVVQNQIKYVFWGNAIGFIFGSTNYFLWYSIPVPPYGNIFSVAFILAITYGLINRNMSIDFTSKKILSWALTFFILFCVLYFPFSFFTNAWGLRNAFFILFEIIFVGLMTIFIINKLNPAIFKDFETRLKNLSEMTTQNFIFNNTKDFGDHLTTNISNIMNAKQTSFFIFNGETGNFDLISSSPSLLLNSHPLKGGARGGSSLPAEVSSQLSPVSSIPFTNPVIDYLSIKKIPIIKSIFGHDKNYNILKKEINNLQVEALFPFFINNKLMAFLTLGDSANNYLYHPKEIQELKYLIKLKEHVFENTYFFEINQEISKMTQSIINIEDKDEFNKTLSSFISRIFNVLNIAVFVYDKEKDIFICKYLRGYDDENLADIKGSNFLIKLLKDNEESIKHDDLKSKTAAYFKNKVSNEALELMEKLKASAVVPLISTNLIGFIAIGQKRIKDDYCQNDLNVLKNISTITAVKIRSFMIQEQSELDPLTKAYNRSALDVWIPKFIFWSKKDKKPIVFLFFDLDHFKLINDQYGHKVGDCVLIELVKIIKNEARSKDKLFRIGGEEFVYVLYGVQEEDVKDIIDRIKQKLKVGEFTQDLTLSIGQVTYVPNRDLGDEVSNEKSIQKTIFRLGDDGAYHSKKKGRNQLQIGGIVEDKAIPEKYTWTLQLIANSGKYYDNFGRYFIRNKIEVKESSFNDSIKIFEQTRPDGFLVIMDENLTLETIKNTIIELKQRSMSSTLGVVLKDYSLKDKLENLSIDRFFSMADQSPIEDWAKVLSKND
jgi:diguanylate cyclase (GGDEF)-like protein